VWLYDDSTRTYICSAQPNLWLEPLYPCAPEGLTEEEREQYDADAYDCPPKPDYRDAGTIGSLPSVAIFDAEIDTPEKEAWDAAREEAEANCRI
jgi:hypothetical protein